MKNRFIALIALFSILVGCVSAPQTPVSLNQNSLKGKKIGIAMTSLPKTDTTILGAGCLLCIATANMANSSLINYSKTLPQENLPEFKNRLAKMLSDKGAETVVISEAIDLNKLPKSSIKGINMAERNFASIKQKYQVDKLLLINVSMLGMVRTYANYIPTSDPKATFKANAYIVDLDSNIYDWYLPVDITKSADGTWDEPPKFPGLTNAYFQVLELGQDSVVKPLVQ